jgi:hypothetical protein
MSDELLPGPIRKLAGKADSLPLFYRRKTHANGESDEISLGPSVVCIFRWLVVLILVALLMLGGARPQVLVHFLLRLLP